MRLATRTEAGEGAMEDRFIERFITAMAAALMLLLFSSTCRWALVLLLVPRGVDDGDAGLDLDLVSFVEAGKAGIGRVCSVLRLRDLDLVLVPRGVDTGDRVVSLGIVVVAGSSIVIKAGIDLARDLDLEEVAVREDGDSRFDTSMVDAKRRREDLDLDLDLGRT